VGERQAQACASQLSDMIKGLVAEAAKEKAAGVASKRPSNWLLGSVDTYTPLCLAPPADNNGRRLSPRRTAIKETRSDTTMATHKN
jgi:hypothetical protein